MTPQKNFRKIRNDIQKEVFLIKIIKTWTQFILLVIGDIQVLYFPKGNLFQDYKNEITICISRWQKIT